MANITSILDKIKKLRALAGNNTSEAEVRAALYAADKLIQQYRLDEATIEAHSGIVSDPLVRRTLTSVGNRSSWKERILSGLCLVYGGCFYLQSTRGERGTNYVCCSRETDYACIEYQFNFLVEEALRLSKANNPFTAVRVATSAIEILAALKSGGLSEDGSGVGWAKSFLEGFSEGLNAQLQGMKAAIAALESSNSAAMVLLNNRGAEAKKFAYAGTRMRSAAGLSGARSDASARSAGYVAGKNVSINKGMNGGGGIKGNLT